jgi:hypothetical protein
VKVTDVYSSLTSLYNDWSGLLVNPNYIRNGTSITWANFIPMPITDPFYSDQVVKLSELVQYSFQVAEDGALIQIRYEYNKNNDLDTASLSYIHPGNFDDSPVGWLRIDYNPSAYMMAIHPSCHMHISLFPDARFQIKGVPNPKQFIEFIFTTFYPKQYHNHRIDEEGNFKNPSHMSSINSPCPVFVADKSFNYLTHIIVPSTPSASPSPFSALARRISRIKN